MVTRRPTHALSFAADGYENSGGRGSKVVDGRLEGTGGVVRIVCHGDSPSGCCLAETLGVIR